MAGSERVELKPIAPAEVRKHNTPESCWVTLYGNVYDVTGLLPTHPGGSQAILRLAGRDATEDYDPIHPPGTLNSLKPEALLGPIIIEAKEITKETLSVSPEENASPSLDSLLNLDEIEELATKNIKPKSWAYYYGASDDQLTKALNTQAYRSILLRPRVFVDCSRCDMSTQILGNRLKVPVFVSPAAAARLAHPSGERGIAAACAKFGALYIISQNASLTPDDIVRDAPQDQVFGWQLYVEKDNAKNEANIARVSKLKAIKFIVLTLDAPFPGKREIDERFKYQEAPVVNGVKQEQYWGTSSMLTWKKTLEWLARQTHLPIVLKGIQTHEDAFIASTFAPRVRGILLSNHGGRALDTAPPAVHTLLEIRKHCPEVFAKLDVLVDGGVKRGTDVVKALALGAKGVGVGRAALWGLGAGGQGGVERTLQILTEETETAMRLLGVEKVHDLGVAHVNTKALESQIYDGPFERSKVPAHTWGKL
ncbi:putative mitochondrial cytochrome b2 [Lophium mytilinum]|uniref:L-lactate dehydrogenase (cytochrome) n=1 Tax=Lophium mytilinum TaxID=390894 RepID=A0A6A6R9V1_9PEZI|nr:putative mitochondrial cytochrome b2 [Lophium mytilinum]